MQATPSPAISPFVTFFETLANAETNLQIDREYVIQAKRSGKSMSAMRKDIQAMSDCIAHYRSTEPKTDDKSMAAVDTRLDALTSNLAQLLVIAMNGQPAKAEERKAWFAHSSAFQAVVLSSLKIPGYSFKLLSPPVAYNLGPILYDEEEAIIYADVSSPDKARVARNFDKKRKLRVGDEIVAYRDDEDESWKDVHTWRDLFHTRGEGGEDEGKQQIQLKIRRGKTVKEVEVGFVASPVYTD